MGSHTWIFSKIQVLHPRLQLQLSTLWAFSSSEELQPTMREPATSWQQEQCSGKRDRLFLSICGNHVLSPSLPPASLPSTSTTSVSLTLPLTAQPASMVGGRQEVGQDSRQAGPTGQDVPRSARKSSLQAATIMEKPSAALRCWTLTLVS